MKTTNEWPDDDSQPERVETESLIDRTLSDSAASERAAEIETVSKIARRYPRAMEAFFMRVKSAISDIEVAESCGYTLPRKNEKKEFIKGPSVGLAEILARCYGNLQI